MFVWSCLNNMVVGSIVVLLAQTLEKTCRRPPVCLFFLHTLPLWRSWHRSGLWHFFVREGVCYCGVGPRAVASTGGWTEHLWLIPNPASPLQPRTGRKDLPEQAGQRPGGPAQAAEELGGSWERAGGGGGHLQGRGQHQGTPPAALTMAVGPVSQPHRQEASSQTAPGSPAGSSFLQGQVSLSADLLTATPEAEGWFPGGWKSSW